MDVSTVVGLIMGIVVMLLAIMIAGASFGAFVDYPSLMVVFCGASAAVMISFPLGDLLSAGKVVKVAFFNKQANVPKLIEVLVGLAETARRDGLLALESKVQDIDDPFIALGIQMAVDGTQPDVIEDVMRTEVDAVATRHRDGKSILDQTGRMAPAFGMIGTLMGLVIMLGNMDDPAAIGPGMAVALLTTMYGAVLANLFAIPMADKLGFINKRELVAMEIVIQGIMGIQSGDNPRVIEQKLNTFIPPKQRAGSQEAA